MLDALAAQCAGKAPGDLVFGDGEYLPRPKSADGWFAAAVRRAGVQPVTPHDLRLVSGRGIGEKMGSPSSPPCEGASSWPT